MDSLNWQDYGIVGLVVGVLLMAFVRYMSAARTDLKESHRQFIEHLQTTGERQTEAIIASTVATSKSVEALRDLAGLMNRHDDRAVERHNEMMEVSAERHEAVLKAIKEEKKAEHPA